MPEISDQELAALKAAAAGVRVEEAPALPNPLLAAQTQVDPYAVKAWGAGVMRKEFDILCPSGQRCRARQVGFEDAIALGILDSMDLFTNNLMTPIIEGTEEGEEADNNKNILAGLKDPEKRANFFGVVNRIVGRAVIIPRVVLEDNGDLPDGTIFVNDIPFGDKMAIFRKVFGGATASLETFQPGQEDVLAAVADVAGVQVPTE